MCFSQGCQRWLHGAVSVQGSDTAVVVTWCPCWYMAEFSAVGFLEGPSTQLFVLHLGTASMGLRPAGLPPLAGLLLVPSAAKGTAMSTRTAGLVLLRWSLVPSFHGVRSEGGSRQEPDPTALCGAQGRPGLLSSSQQLSLRDGRCVSSRRGASFKVLLASFLPAA